MFYKTIALVVALSVLGWMLTMAVLSILARRPSGLGVREGRLASCPSSPNCVCSFDTDRQHGIDPIAFEGSPEDAWSRLRTILVRWPRTHIITESPTYLHVECASAVFRFVDDVEFLLDHDKGVIHVRSASRSGRSDLGVNRARVEAIRQEFSSLTRP